MTGIGIGVGISFTENKNVSQYILDQVQGAVAAYALRKIKNTAIKCIRVRRSSDNTEQDIGFTGSIIDAASLLAFVGAGIGHVVKWYDQSEFGNDAVQTTAASQLTIVESGVLLDGIKNPTNTSRLYAIPTLENTSFPQTQSTVLICYKKITAWTAGYSDYATIWGTGGNNKKAIFMQKRNTADSIGLVIQNGIGYNALYSSNFAFTETGYTCFGLAYSLGTSSSSGKTLKNGMLINENTSITPDIYPIDTKPYIGGAIDGFWKYHLIFNRYLPDSEVKYINDYMGY